MEGENKMFQKDHYKEAYKNLKNENKKLRSSLENVNKVSESKDDILEKVLEENEELKVKMDELQKKGGSIVGTVTQIKNKYCENELKPQSLV